MFRFLASAKPEPKPVTTKPKPQPPKPSAPNIKNEDEKAEYFESEADLSLKLDALAEWIKNSKHCIVFTGAGISTSTGIPDFRSGMNTVLKTGPGIWELRDKGATRSCSAKVVSSLKAIPSVSHMAIVKLHQEGLVKYTVSQNVDGLHLRSGIHSDQLAELHGNTNLETCTKCRAKYLRDFNTRTAHSVFDHVTGRRCDNPACQGQLVDSIINFGESLPAEELDRSFQEAHKSDLCLVFGSSLRVNPAAEVPATVLGHGKKVVICNLQKTPLNPYCAMEIHAEIDDVTIGVMKRLGLEIPKFIMKRRLAVDIAYGKISFQGLDATKDTPYSFLREMEVTFIRNDDGKDCVAKKIVLPCEPYVTPLPQGVTVPFKVEIVLRFHGHYGEPDLAMRETFSSTNRTLFELSYEVRNGGPWKVIRN